MPRRKPYTDKGIRRVPCARCGSPSFHQWQVCADGNVYRGLCHECDVGLNAVAMRFVFGDSCEDKIEGYRRRMLDEKAGTTEE